MEDEPLSGSFTIGDCGSCYTQVFLPFEFYDQLLATIKKLISHQIPPMPESDGWYIKISHGTLVNSADETAKYQFMAVVPARDYILWFGGGGATDDILDMHAL